MCQESGRGRAGERERKVAGAKAVALKYGQLNCQTVNFVLTSLKNFSLLRHEGRVYTGLAREERGRAVRKISIWSFERYVERLCLGFEAPVRLISFVSVVLGLVVAFFRA